METPRHPTDLRPATDAVQRLHKVHRRLKRELSEHESRMEFVLRMMLALLFAIIVSYAVAVI